MGATGAPLDAHAPLPPARGHRRPGPGLARAELVSRHAYGGLDLAAKLDTTAWSLRVPDGLDGVPSMMWRFWLPEAAVKFLDGRTNGRVSQVARGRMDHRHARRRHRLRRDLRGASLRTARRSRSWPPGYDEWSGEPVRQEIQKKTRLDLTPIPQTYRASPTA